MRRVPGILLVVFACGGPGAREEGDDPAGGCSDGDGDGYGIGGGCLGPDCNDWVTGIHTDAQCDDYCAASGDAPGCPCIGEGAARCYPGPLGSAGIGACREGAMRCGEDGRWGGCDGAIVPDDERCDGLDDDCDGDVDEGVQNECGTCGRCLRACFGSDADCGAWDEGEPSGVVETPEGWLAIDPPAIEHHLIWPSSLFSGGILRVNTETLDIEGAYWSGPDHGVLVPLPEGPGGTAVDTSGSVVITNRGERTQGSVTKIASEDSLCVDRNGNGRIDTSRSWDTPLGFDDHETWEDECILWHTTVGGFDATLYSVVLHPEIGLDGASIEAGWVSVYNGFSFEQLDTETGELTGIIAPTPGFRPAFAAVDRDGIVWTSGSGALGRFDTADPEGSFETFDAGSPVNYIAVDENGAPWVSVGGLFAGEDWGVWRFDRDAERFDAATFDDSCNEYGVSNGALATDRTGSMWVSSFGGDECVFRVTNAPGEDGDLHAHAVATPGVPNFGVVIDLDGHAWAFSPVAGNAARIDLETEATEVVLDPDDCGGSSCLVFPWIVGDATGLGRRDLGALGAWSTVLEGCVSAGDSGTDWNRIEVDADAPLGSEIAVRARTADSLPGLEEGEWIGVGVMPVDGRVFDLDAAFEAAGVEDAHLLEVHVTLDGQDAVPGPVLRGVEVWWTCEEEPE